MGTTGENCKQWCIEINQRQEHKRFFFGWGKSLFAWNLGCSFNFEPLADVSRKSHVNMKQVLKNGALMTAPFLQASHQLFISHSMPHNVTSNTWHCRYIVLESSVSRQDWIPKCHLSLSSFLFLALSLTWTFPLSQVSRTGLLFQQETS